MLIKIISNIINCIGSTLNMIGVNVKDKSKVLIFFIFGNLCVAIALGLLNAKAGMFVQLTFVVETIINYFWDKKNDKYPIWMILLYVIVPCILLIITFDSVWNILPLIGGIVFPLALLSKGFKLRFLNFISVVVWIPYNFHVGQYVGTISCIIFAIMNAIAIIRLDIIKRKDEPEGIEK